MVFHDKFSNMNVGRVSFKNASTGNGNEIRVPSHRQPQKLCGVDERSVFDLLRNQILRTVEGHFDMDQISAIGADNLFIEPVVERFIFVEFLR